MRGTAQEEDLNLQDLIFILLFFFIIAQTLIVFKLEKDLIEEPNVKDKITVQDEQDKNKELITLVIDHKSNVVALVEKTGRDTIVEGFEKIPEKQIMEIYCDPFEGKEEYIPSEEKKAYEEIAKQIKRVKALAGFTKPRIGLIADHKARYGTIFQVNLALQELVGATEAEQVIAPGFTWKIYDPSTMDVGEDEDLPSLFDSATPPTT